MIDFRVLLVSLASIFFALAVGVTLGAGPLRGDADEHLRADLQQMGQEKQTLRRELERLERKARYQDAFAATVAPSLVKERLVDQRVVLVSLPGADESTIAGLRGMVAAAGGTVTGTVQVSARWADPAQRQFLDELANRLAPSAAGTTSTYERAGALVARALVSRREGAGEPGPGATPGPDLTAGSDGTPGPDGPAAMIIGALREGQLLEADPGLVSADLAIVVAPSRSREQHQATEAWLALARALDQNSQGVVMAGDSSSGLLGGLRANAQVSAEVSTVDVANLTSGQVAVVWALVEQQHGGVGHYGAVDHAHGAAPREASNPEPEVSGADG